MAKVTSKLQVTIPKAIAQHHGIEPGDEIDWLSSGASIRVVPRVEARGRHPDAKVRLELFDQQMKRIEELQRSRNLPVREERDWKREDLYGERGRPR